MALLEILIYPHPSLRKQTQEVTAFTPELKARLKDMAETMYNAPGVGLAGPQVGVNEKILVVDIGLMAKEGEKNPGLLEVINPKILSSAGESVFQEGCLSLPGLLVNVERPAEIELTYQDAEGRKQELKAEGLLATVLQHEMDHLNGVLILDRLSSLKRNRYGSWLKKQLKKRDEGELLDQDNVFGD